MASLECWMYLGERGSGKRSARSAMMRRGFSRARTVNRPASETMRPPSKVTWICCKATFPRVRWEVGSLVMILSLRIDVTASGNTGYIVREALFANARCAIRASGDAEHKVPAGNHLQPQQPLNIALHLRGFDSSKGKVD